LTLSFPPTLVRRSVPNSNFSGRPSTRWHFPHLFFPSEPTLCPTGRLTQNQSFCQKGRCPLTHLHQHSFSFLRVTATAPASPLLFSPPPLDSWFLLRPGWPQTPFPFLVAGVPKAVKPLFFPTTSFPSSLGPLPALPPGPLPSGVCLSLPGLGLFARASLKWIGLSRPGFSLSQHFFPFLPPIPVFFLLFPFACLSRIFP